MKELINTRLAVLAMGGALIGTVSAATISMSKSDAYGVSSWSSGANWPNGAKPVAGNDYVIPEGMQMCRNA